MKSEIQKAVEAAGSEAALAAECRVHQDTVTAWLKAGRPSRLAARLIALLFNLDEERLRK